MLVIKVTSLSRNSSRSSRSGSVFETSLQMADIGSGFFHIFSPNADVNIDI
jgi:hypothetical protein